eukprot:PhM_4_TR12930/c0_g1_i1/m.25647
MKKVINPLVEPVTKMMSKADAASAIEQHKHELMHPYPNSVPHDPKVPSVHPQMKHMQTIPNTHFQPLQLLMAMALKGAYGMMIDGIGQVAEARMRDEEINYDVFRSMRYASVGVFLLAPIDYVEWLIISRAFPHLTLTHAVAKTSLDIFLLHPFNACVAMYANEMLRSKGDHKTAVAKIRQDFFSLQWRMICIRPIVDMIAFMSMTNFVSQALFVSSVYLSIDVFVNIATNRVVNDPSEVAFDVEIEEGEERDIEEVLEAEADLPAYKRTKPPERYACFGLFWFAVDRKTVRPHHHHSSASASSSSEGHHKLDEVEIVEDNDNTRADPP